MFNVYIGLVEIESERAARKHEREAGIRCPAVELPLKAKPGLNGPPVQYIREFLNAFEKLRSDNRVLAADPARASSVDSELLTFDRLNRSTDEEPQPC